MRQAGGKGGTERGKWMADRLSLSSFCAAFGPGRLGFAIHLLSILRFAPLDLLVPDRQQMIYEIYKLAILGRMLHCTAY
jgi:hypothetical protein